MATTALPGGPFDEDEVVHQEDITPPLREALLAARDGEYQTDSVSEALLAGIDEFRNYNNIQIDPYVRLDGTTYVFEPTVPTFVAELADETVEDYDRERVAHFEEEFESEAVERFVQALSITGTMTARATYRVCVRPDAVTDFLDQYDYVEDTEGVSRIRTRRENEAPPYTIDVRELTDEDVYGRRVIDAGTLDADLRAFLSRLIDSDHFSYIAPADTSVYLTDDVPDAYFETVRPDDESADTPYLRVDGTVYRVDVNDVDHDAVPLDVSLEATAAPTDGRTGFSVTFEATGGGPDTAVAEGTQVEVQDFGAFPSPLWLVNGDDRSLLESDAYEAEAVAATVRSLEHPPESEDIATERFEVGESTSATYVVPEDVPPGQYVSRGLPGVQWQDPTTDVRTDSATYPFELTVTVPDS